MRATLALNGLTYEKNYVRLFIDTAQKMKFAIENLFSKCEQIRRKQRIWLHLLKKSLMEYFIFCAVRPADFELII